MTRYYRLDSEFDEYNEILTLYKDDVPLISIPFKHNNTANLFTCTACGFEEYCRLPILGGTKTFKNFCFNCDPHCYPNLKGLPKLKKI